MTFTLLSQHNWLSALIALLNAIFGVPEFSTDYNCDAFYDQCL